MTVILVNEINHGLLTIAKDYQSAVKFLFNQRWITERTEVWNGRNSWVQLIDEFLGDPLGVMLVEWDINDFNEYWDNSFYLEEMTVYEC